MEDRRQYRIVSIKQETATAKTYELMPMSGKVNYIPGQFLTFILNIDGNEYRRSYSIISLPDEPLRITVQRIENGTVSRYIMIQWKPGLILDALPPAGRFILKPSLQLSRDLFFLAAGSGITPILPQIRLLLKEEPLSRIHLLYSSNTEDSIVFRKEIEELGAYKNFKVHYFLSNPKTEWKKRQRLNNGILEDLVKEEMTSDPGLAVFMICGPFTYMRMARLTLIFMKFDEDQIRTENFLPEILRSGTRVAPHYANSRVEIEWKGTSYQVDVKAGETILRSALNAGIALPYSCEGGICSACAAICSKGKVKMTINEVLSNQDQKEGWILTCTGYPAEPEVKIVLP